MSAPDWAQPFFSGITRAIQDGFAGVNTGAGAGGAGVGAIVGGAANLSGEAVGALTEYITGMKDLGETAKELTKQSVVLEASYEGLGAMHSLMATQLPGVADGFIRVGIQARQAAFDFNALTGAGGEFDEQIFQVRENLKEFPVTGREVSDTVTKLFRGFTDFSLGGLQPTEVRLAETITILGKLGASVGDQVEIVQGLRKVFSQSDTQIDNSLRGFEALADTLNMDVGVVMQNFRNQIPLFASFGDNAVSAFKRMQMQSKATGIEMNKLVNISEGFTTIESSAKVVGQLNQLLGDTGLLPADLMTAALEDPAKAMDMLQGALSGFDVDNLGGGMKRALSEILGFGKDIDEFISFARGGTEALEQMDLKKAKTDTEMLQRLQPATPYDEMANSIANATLSVDGLASKAKSVDQVLFAESLPRIKAFRDAASEVTDEFGKFAEGKLGIDAGGFDDFLTNFRKTLNEAVPTTETIQTLIEEDKKRTEELVSSIKNMQVHVYLDKDKLGEQIAPTVAKTIMK